MGIQGGNKNIVELCKFRVHILISQGSGLGPLLYSFPLVTLQDIMACLIIFYADDTQFYFPLKRHLLRICRFGNLLLKTALGILTCGC